MKKKLKKARSVIVTLIGFFLMSSDRFAVMLIGAGLLAVGALDITLQEVEKWM